MKRFWILAGLIGIIIYTCPAAAQQFSYNFPGSSDAALSTVRLDNHAETLTGAKTLTISDSPVQRLDPNGSDRDVTLPDEAVSTDLTFWIYNTADGAGEDLTIKNDTPAAIVTLGPGMGMMFTCDGTDWVAIGDDGIVYDAQADTISFGSAEITTTGAANAATLNTGQGDYELYAMNQDMETTDSPTFVTTDLTGVADGNLAYMQAAGAGFGDSPLSRTDADTLTFQSTTGKPAILNLYSDAAEDNADKWRVQVADGGNVTLESYATGAWVAVATWTNAGALTMTGDISGTTVNTGQGAYELYAMNQDVETTDAVTFATVDTGQGANELYAMNQDVETTDSPTFVTTDLTGVADGNLAYMQAAGAGFGDSPLSRTDADTLTFQSTTGKAAILNLYSDAAEDNSDKWRVQVADGGNVTLESYATGAWVAVATWTNAGALTMTGDIAGTTVNTGQGAYELYAMNQDVETTDAVTFATVNTGQGAYELYAMNQDVETTDAVTFATVDTGQGANELYAMNQDMETTDSPTFVTAKLSGLADNRIPYHVSDATGLADSPISTDGTHTTVGGLTTAQASATVADEAEITLATGVAGFGFAQAGDNEQWIQFSFTTDGVVTVIANSANAVNTDTDGNLCVYDAGSGIAIKNRLGGSKTVRYSVKYSL